MSTSGSDAYSMSADAMTQAGQGAQAAMGYRPMMVGRNMDPYMNPYTEQVVQTSQDALYDANQMAMNDIGYGATQAGAFGGSRHGVAEAETNAAYLDANAQMTANLYNQGYGQALNAQMANQQAGLAGASLNLQGANSLANIGTAGFNQANTLANQQYYYGAQQQAANQALIDQSAAQWAGYTAAPAAGLSYTGGAVTPLYGSAPTSTTQSYQPGLMDYMMLPLAF